MEGQGGDCMGDMLQPSTVVMAAYIWGLLLRFSENIGFCCSKMHKKSNKYWYTLSLKLFFETLYTYSKVERVV